VSSLWSVITTTIIYSIYKFGEQLTNCRLLAITAQSTSDESVELAHYLRIPFIKTKFISLFNGLTRLSRPSLVITSVTDLDDLMLF
jgi:hypothetical protein